MGSTTTNPHGPPSRSAYVGKRLGIMQPYFFPYLGYFGLIASTDRWIVFDPVQYIRKGWMNRNRVLKAGGGEKLVGVSVAAHARETRIKDMRLAPDPRRFDVFVRQLDAYKLARAPFYDEVVALLRDCFDTTTDALVPFLVRCLDLTCAHIGIPLRYEIYSQMELSHPEPTHPMEWSLFTCVALGVSEYLNPPGGRTFFDARRFSEAGVRLRFYEQELPAYEQGRRPFVAGLSVIDAMMFNTPEQIRAMLMQHRVCDG